MRAQLLSADLDDVEEGVRARLKRQEILTRPKPPFIRAYLDQSVIERPMGSAEIQRDQLARLLELAELPRVTVRVVPTDSGAHVGRDGSFHVMTVDGTDVAFTETIGPGRLVRDVSEVRAYAHWFERIGDVALLTRASPDLIRETMEGLT